jgi:putative Mg2+ transporter-C (MgtC) family protein
MVLGAALGMAIGLQRARSHKSVGMRTLGLIGLGSALATSMLASFPSAGPADASRMMQGILTGTGFLGAGVILRGRGVHRVHGLTTAAAIWLTALIGATAGLGLYVPATLGAAIGIGLLMIPEDVDH